MKGSIFSPYSGSSRVRAVAIASLVASFSSQI